MHHELQIRRFVLASWLFGVFSLSFIVGSLSIQIIEVWVINLLPLLFLSLAAAVVISCGQIDISTGGVMSLVGMTILFVYGFPANGLGSALLAHAVALTLVILLYWIYSIAVNRGVSSLLVTLSVLMLSKGASTLLQTCMQGAGELCRSSTKFAMGNATLPQQFVLPYMDNVFFATGVLAIILLLATSWRFHSRWGLEHIAVGMDQTSAKYSRIAVSKIYTLAFLTAGILVFIASLIRLHGQANGGWSANVGWGEELLAIAVAVIGGTRVTGGRFDPLSIILATAAVYTSRDIVTNDLGVPSEVASMFFGLVLFVIVWLDTRAQNFRAKHT
ncbi:ABC transporter permease subunit [Kordiimonas marina]|uniref:ABC transporter permease subunit n=1 Tax=Kordiimonas marina TaxID=2872312 RepID=UPI001FF1D41D|nr:hypothetical protein [Kordiimonas marina]MCJ9430748.1 hypothetical protein [Kordiimonas marina]